MSDLTDSVIVYRVERQPDRKVFDMTGYKGQSTPDVGYFYCPYIPGAEPPRPLTDAEKNDLWVSLWLKRQDEVETTQIQKRIMRVVKGEPDVDVTDQES